MAKVDLTKQPYNLDADVVYEQNKVLQGHSKYPVLIAANTGAGGDLVDSFTGFEDTRYSSADKYANRINPV